MNIHGVRTIVGILGNIASLGLTLLSNWPHAQKIIQTKSSEEFSKHAVNYVLGIFSCCLWIFYTSSWLSPHYTLYLIMNAAVLVSLVGFFGIFLRYVPGELRAIGLKTTFGSGVFRIVVLWLSDPTPDCSRKCFVRIVSFPMNLAKYLAMYGAHKPNSPPLWLCLASMADCCVWVIYSQFPPTEIYVTVINCLGMFVGFLAMLAYLWNNPHPSRVADSSQV